MVRLQQQTLSAVNALIDIHQQLLKVKKTKLEVKRELLSVDSIEFFTLIYQPPLHVINKL